jgi:hypothetical protein
MKGALAIRADAASSALRSKRGRNSLGKPNPPPCLRRACHRGRRGRRSARNARDGAAISGKTTVTFRAIEGPAEIVLTDTL